MARKQQQQASGRSKAGETEDCDDGATTADDGVSDGGGQEGGARSSRRDSGVRPRRQTAGKIVADIRRRVRDNLHGYDIHDDDDDEVKKDDDDDDEELLEFSNDPYI